MAALGHAASVRSTLRVTSRWRAHPGMVDYLQTIVMPRLSAYPEGLFWTVPLQSGREDGVTAACRSTWTMARRG